MTHESLISTHELVENLENPKFAIFDCRFSLGDTEKGQRDYVEAHIPGAVYAHLDKDLCAPVIPGRTGRHPLPEIDQLVEKFTRWGIETGVQVVAYDDYPEASGAFAARLCGRYATSDITQLQFWMVVGNVGEMRKDLYGVV